MNRIKLLMAAAVAVGLLYSTTQAATIPDVLQQIDAATGKAKDSATEFSVTGIVSVRATLKDDQVLAFVQPAGEAGLPVLASKADAAQLLPRNEVKLSGKLVDGPLGFVVLQVTASSVTVSGSNQPFGAPEARGAEFFKDASALAGHYVKLTSVSFPGGKFDDSGIYKVKGDAGKVTIRASKALAGHDAPAGSVNVYGVPIKVDGGWQLLTARILPMNGKETADLATKYTCLTCHTPDTKLVGPAYRDVAAKYRDDGDAEQKIIAQIENGGSGKWGVVPMLPFKDKVPADDMKQIAQWILGYRWDAILAE